MNVLVACEESQRVCIEFRKRGHNAFSCDLIPCSGGYPEWHIMGSCEDVMSGFCSFRTMDGSEHSLFKRWDMIIAFPPCTHLAVSGASWFEQKRQDGRQRDAILFFLKFFDVPCEKIAVENPINIISGNYIKKWFPDLCEYYGLPFKATQIIQPYQFGEHARKSTCLWLKGLPKLQPTNIVDPGIILKGGFSVGASSHYATDEQGKILAWNDPRTAVIRSKTFPGIAKAMAEQWG